MLWDKHGSKFKIVLINTDGKITGTAFTVTSEISHISLHDPHSRKLCFIRFLHTYIVPSSSKANADYKR